MPGEGREAMVEVARQAGITPVAYTVTQLAGALQISYRTALRMVHDGQIGHIPCGGEYRIPATEVQRALDEATAATRKTA